MYRRAFCFTTVALLGGLPAQANPPLYQVPPLPYSYDALEPFIDARTMGFHHDRHHSAYLTYSPS